MVKSFGHYTYLRHDYIQRYEHLLKFPTIIQDKHKKYPERKEQNQTEQKYYCYNKSNTKDKTGKLQQLKPNSLRWFDL